MTASSRGRDDLPATEESLPSHSPGGCLVPSSDGDRLKRTAGRLTKPLRSGRGRACPSAIAKAAGFDQRPSGPGPSSDGKGTGTGPKAFGPADRPGRTPDLRIQDQPGGKRCLRAGALPPARKELRLRTWSGRTGFRPGSCEPGVDPGLRLMAMSGGTRGFGRGSCRTRFHGPRSMKAPMAWKRNASSESAERRTVRASALSGSHRGNLRGFGPDGLRRMRGQDLSWSPRLEKAHCGRPASAEPDAKGQWGPAAMPGPITVWGLAETPFSPNAFVDCNSRPG